LVGGDITEFGGMARLTVYDTSFERHYDAPITAHSIVIDEIE
jgi:hypothetical protein